MTSSAVHLRPRGASELVDAAFALVRARAGALATLGGLMALPGLVQTALLVALAPATGDTTGPANLDAMRGALLSGGYGWPATLVIVATFLAGLVLWIVCSGASLLVAAGAYMGAPQDVGDAVRTARGRLVPLASAFVQKGVLAAILMGFGFLASTRTVFGAIFAIAGKDAGSFGPMILAMLVVVTVTVLPAALLLATFSMTAPAVLLEGVADGTRALGRSSALTTGRRWQLLGVYAVLYVISIVLGLAIQWGISLAGHTVLGEIVGDLVWVAALPVILALTAVAYYDLRIRREGLDLELLATAQPPAPAPAAAPAPAGQPA